MPLYIKKINHKVLLYSTGNYVQYIVTNDYRKKKAISENEEWASPGVWGWGAAQTTGAGLHRALAAPTDLPGLLHQIGLFISYDNATKQLDTVYDVTPELAQAFLERISSSSFDMRNTSTIHRQGAWAMGPRSCSPSEHHFL